MGGRFGKYGDVKRRQTLRKVRREKNRLESERLRDRTRDESGRPAATAFKGKTRRDRFSQQNFSPL